MGKWKNAPVVYVIVQVRFSPVLSLPTYLPQIQEHFRKAGFPGFANRFNFQLGFSLGQTPSPEAAAPPLPVERTSSYVFFNRDNSQSVILEPNGLTLHVTDYEDFDWFMSLFLEQLEKVNQVIGPDFSERIGLRYIDAIVPNEGKTVWDYLTPEAAGPRKVGGFSPQHSFLETMFAMERTSVVSRVLIRDGQIAFPPDLASFQISVDPRFSNYRGAHATVDTDAFQSGASPMDLNQIRGSLEELHSAVNKTFRTVVTDHALAEWR
jgi:uncharacterized protein (TIGR04255 family)